MTTNRHIHPIRLLIGGVTLISISALAVWGLIQLNTPAMITLATDSGTALNPPQSIDNFTLTATDGNPIDFDALSGNYTLLSFGYTHCPDVCPLTLTEFKRVKRELGDAADEVNFVFISVDGERDTPDLLGRYLERFDPAFIGMTSSDDSQTRAVAEAFSVFYEKRELEGTAATYMVDHTASIFLINPRGEIVALYAFGTPPVDIATDLSGLL